MAVKSTTTKKAATTKAAPKAAATKAAPKKAATPKKVAAPKAPKSTLYINAENIGFKAGDVYQALASQNAEMTVAQIAKAAGISVEEAYLGIGWLLKEGKVTGNEELVKLA